MRGNICNISVEPNVRDQSGHLQTLYCVLGDFSKRDRIMYDRQVASPFNNHVHLDSTIENTFA